MSFEIPFLKKGEQLHPGKERQRKEARKKAYKTEQVLGNISLKITRGKAKDELTRKEQERQRLYANATVTKGSYFHMLHMCKNKQTSEEKKHQQPCAHAAEKSTLSFCGTVQSVLELHTRNHPQK